MKTVKWVALAMLVLVVGLVVFADDEQPAIGLEDQVTILRYQKQQSDIQAQYNQLYANFLQSPQVTSLTAQNATTNALLNDAIGKALEKAKIDKTKFTLDPSTLKPVPLHGPAQTALPAKQ